MQAPFAGVPRLEAANLGGAGSLAVRAVLLGQSVSEASSLSGEGCDGDSEVSCAEVFIDEGFDVECPAHGSSGTGYVGDFGDYYDLQVSTPPDVLFCFL